MTAAEALRRSVKGQRRSVPGKLRDRGSLPQQALLEGRRREAFIYPACGSK